MTDLSNDKLQQQIEKAEKDAEKALTKAKSLRQKQAAMIQKRQTKQKILYGAAAMSLFENDAELKKRFDEFMPKFLKRDSDRAVFGLQPLPKEGK